jgi:uncharacterized RDD family membrane protein YckC
MTSPARLGVTGNYAGPVSRAVAMALDVGIIFSAFTVGVAGVELLARVVVGLELTGDRSGVGWLIGFVVWAFLYSLLSLAIAGRTPGKGVVGLRVVSSDGTVITGRRALVRTIAFPLSAVAFGLGFAGIVIGRRHRALHDVIAGTVVVYDWGGRDAELSAPLSAFLSRRAGRDYAGTGNPTD